MVRNTNYEDERSPQLQTLDFKGTEAQQSQKNSDANQSMIQDKRLVQYIYSRNNNMGKHNTISRDLLKTIKSKNINDDERYHKIETLISQKKQNTIIKDLNNLVKKGIPSISHNTTNPRPSNTINPITDEEFFELSEFGNTVDCYTPIDFANTPVSTFDNKSASAWF